VHRLVTAAQTETNFEMKIKIVFPTFSMNAISISFLTPKTEERPSSLFQKINIFDSPPGFQVFDDLASLTKLHATKNR
jgi:hypothetical protein